MILKGKVKSGLGEANYWVKKIEKIFLQKENVLLYPGTLNIKLNNKFNIQNPDFIIKKCEYEGTENLYIRKCTVLNEKSYIIRTEKNSKENGDHPLDVIEILSEINFREKYNLKNDEEIEIIV